MRVAPLPSLDTLRSLVDDHLEQSLVDRAAVEETVCTLLDRLVPVLGLRAAFVHTYTEDLALQTMGSQGFDATSLQAFCREEAPRRSREAHALGSLFVEQLDVAGTWFGAAGFVADADHETDLGAHLHTVCELLDNHLYAVAAAQRKHRTMLRLGDALRHHVLDHGLAAAVELLVEEVPIKRLLLVYLAEDGVDAPLHVLVYEGKTCVVDTMENDDPGMRALAARLLSHRDHALLERTGLTRDGSHALEEILISGITDAHVVGELFALPMRRQFNTYDRDLLQGFAGFVRQRIVDFNKEWRSLASAFRDEDVGRLIRTPGYRERYLQPREETAAILFADIAGFTRISEQVLQSPTRIAELVQLWSHEAVRIVWKHGGTFDKMVGDCIIALFGPPFYELDHAGRMRAALACASELLAMTNALPEREELAALRPLGLALSTGVNLAPVSVGLFGPDQDFTAFSSGMNNTARLQGCARANEILVMDGSADLLLDDPQFAFGPVQEMGVKNVAEPLRFRALLG